MDRKKIYMKKKLLIIQKKQSKQKIIWKENI